MPLLNKQNLQIDYADTGDGPVVMLIHSPVSENRQWLSLSESLHHDYRVVAINLYSYGQTTPWPVQHTQKPDDQVE